jgi:hypothetical protein
MLLYICELERVSSLQALIKKLFALLERSWVQIQRSGFDSRRYQIFWEVVGLERGPLILVSTTEELLERKSNGSGLENRDYSRRGCAATPLYPTK